MAYTVYMHLLKIIHRSFCIIYYGHHVNTSLNPRKAAEFRLPRTAKRCHLIPMHLTHINDTLFCSSLEKMIGFVNRTYLSCVCWDSLLELLQ